jgi:hypothetical protein
MKRLLISFALVAGIGTARAEDTAPSRIDTITKSARDMMPAMPEMPSLSLPSMPDLIAARLFGCDRQSHDRIQHVHATGRRRAADP